MNSKQQACLLACLWFCFYAAAQSLQIQTRDGKLYKDATIDKTDPEGLTISYTVAGGRLGIAKLKFPNLPADLQKKYGYDATNATAFEARERMAASQWRMQLIANENATQDSSREREHADQLAQEEDLATASGTAFFITDDGYLLTCNHVVSGATRVTISTKDALYPADVVRTDPDNDVALLKVTGSFHSLPLTVDANTNANLGDSIFTIGFPVISLQGIEPKLTTGAINSLDGAQDDPTEYQISAAVQPGNSGGPLIDQSGNVIGIVCARISDQAALQESGMIAQNVNYALKSNLASSVIDSEPGLSAKLKRTYAPGDRKFSEIVHQTQDAVVLVLAH
jgi:S1-C subfamily serine protease